MEARNSKSGSSLKADDFRLWDYRIVSIKAERLVDPNDEKDEEGVTRSKVEPHVHTPDRDAPSDIAGAEITFHLDGFRDETGEDGATHFTICVCAEFLFKAAHEGWVESSDFQDVVRSFIIQAYPLLALKARSIAHEMGYSGVDPHLGLRIPKRPASKSPATSKPAAKKRVKRAT
ncbi:hypothetical protein [Burkholderia ubonensis]|uniref:hypothetical protein n=1 Tax=Burkholderia ubonensis TaxID=101571 RepID=UPI0012FA22F5|nr:hypothetical protein [Burkholderia ubonensis]